MASKRAFGILNHQNQANGNLYIGKNLHSAKGSDTRTSSAFALKDLTNKTHRTFIHQDGEGKSSTVSQGKQQLKSSVNSIVRKIGVKAENAAAPLPKSYADASGYDKFSPQSTEYAWGQMDCLRDDLLEQMLDFSGVSCAIERKPLPPVTVEPLDLTDGFPPMPDHWSRLEMPRCPEDTLDPLDGDLPLIDVPDLEFMF